MQRVQGCGIRAVGAAGLRLPGTLVRFGRRPSGNEANATEPSAVVAANRLRLILQKCDVGPEGAKAQLVRRQKKVKSVFIVAGIGPASDFGALGAGPLAVT